jgi:uncharacterized membrane protein
VETRWSDLNNFRERFNFEEDDVDEAIASIKEFVTIVGVIGYILVMCQALAMHFTIKLLTVPMIMKNLVRDSNCFLIVIGIGQMITGAQSYEHTYLDAGNEWVAVLFLTTGAIIFVLAVVGIVGARWKDRNLLALYLGNQLACLSVQQPQISALGTHAVLCWMP